MKNGMAIMKMLKVLISSTLLFVSCAIFYFSVHLQQCFSSTTLEKCENDSIPDGSFCGWQWAFSIIDDEVMIQTIMSNPGLYDRLVDRFGKENDFVSPELFSDKKLSQDEVKWILKEVGVSLGDAYILYVPEEKSISMAHVVGVTVAKSGTGVPLELFSLILRPDSTLHDKDKDHSRPIGIVKSEAHGAFPKFDIVLLGPNDQRYREALAFAKEMVKKGDGDVELEDYAFLYDGVNPAILYKHVTEGLICLGCLVFDDGKWKLGAFSGDIRIVNGMVPIEEENVEHDLGMYDTIFTVLNDIDGNGFAEVYIKSTISYIYEFDKNCRIKYRTGFYNGP